MNQIDNCLRSTDPADEVGLPKFQTAFQGKIILQE